MAQATTACCLSHCMLPAWFLTKKLLDESLLKLLSFVKAGSFYFLNTKGIYLPQFIQKLSRCNIVYKWISKPQLQCSGFLSAKCSIVGRGTGDVWLEHRCPIIWKGKNANQSCFSCILLSSICIWTKTWYCWTDVLLVSCPAHLQ